MARKKLPWTPVGRNARNLAQNRHGAATKLELQWNEVISSGSDQCTLGQNDTEKLKFKDCRKKGMLFFGLYFLCGVNPENRKVSRVFFFFFS